MWRLAILAGTALGFRLYSRRLLSLPDTASFQTFFDLITLQSKMFCDFSVRFSGLVHGLQIRYNNLRKFK